MEIIYIYKTKKTPDELMKIFCSRSSFEVLGPDVIIKRWPQTTETIGEGDVVEFDLKLKGKNIHCKAEIIKVIPNSLLVERRKDKFSTMTVKTEFKIQKDHTLIKMSCLIRLNNIILFVLQPFLNLSSGFIEQTYSNINKLFATYDNKAQAYLFKLPIRFVNYFMFITLGICLGCLIV